MYTEEAPRSQLDNKENPSPPMPKNLRNSSNKKKVGGFGAANSENSPAPISGFANQTITENNTAASLAVKSQNSATKKTLFGDATAATNNFAVSGNDSSEPVDKMFAGLA